MNTIKTLFVASLITFSFAANAAPSETECTITDAVESPAGLFFKLPVILSNPVSACGFAAVTWRNSHCPREQLMTKSQVEAMIREALQAQQIQPMIEDHYKDVASNSLTD